MPGDQWFEPASASVKDEAPGRIAAPGGPRSPGEDRIELGGDGPPVARAAVRVAAVAEMPPMTPAFPVQTGPAYTGLAQTGPAHTGPAHTDLAQTVRAFAKVPGALSVPRRPPPEWPPIPKMVERPPVKRHVLLFHPGAPQEKLPAADLPLMPAPLAPARPASAPAAPARPAPARPAAARPAPVLPAPDRPASARPTADPVAPPDLPVPPALPVREIRPRPVEHAPPTSGGGTAHSGDDGAEFVRKSGSARRLGRRAALPAVVALVAAFVAATGYLAFVGRYPQAGSELGRWAAVAAPTSAAGAAGSQAVSRPPGDPFGTAAVVASGAPSSVRIKAIGLDTTLEKLHLGDDGALVPPHGFEKAGWYADGTAPGDVGPAVIAGHVDSKSGPAVFYRLRELTTGDRIEVVRGGVLVVFTVTRTAWYPKDKFPTAAVYGPTPDRQLRLITCGGVFDHTLRSYKDNLVVYAVAG